MKFFKLVDINALKYVEVGSQAGGGVCEEPLDSSTLVLLNKFPYYQLSSCVSLKTVLVDVRRTESVYRSTEYTPHTPCRQS